MLKFHVHRTKMLFRSSRNHEPCVLSDLTARAPCKATLSQAMSCSVSEDAQPSLGNAAVAGRWCTNTNVNARLAAPDSFGMTLRKSCYIAVLSEQFV